MEKTPIYQSESASDKGGTSKEKKSEGLGFGPAFRPVENPVPSHETPKPRSVEHHHVPLEGVISWRDEEFRHHRVDQESKDTDSRSNEDEDNEETDNKKSKKQPQLQHPSASAPRPIPEVTQPNLTAEKQSDEEDADDTTGTSQATADQLSAPTSYEVATGERVPEPEQFDEQTTARPVYHGQASAPATVFAGTPPEHRSSHSGESQAHPVFGQNEVPIAQGYTAETYVQLPQSEATLPVQLAEERPTAASAEAAPSPYADIPYEQFNQMPVVQGEGGGEQPPVPPTASNTYNQPPSGPPRYPGYDPYMHPSYGGERSVMAAPPMPLERPAVPTSNHDPRLGPVAATLGLGLVAEHIGRKRADRKQQQQIDRITNGSKNLAEQTVASSRQFGEQQRIMTAEQQRQAAEMHQWGQPTRQEQYVAPASYTAEQSSSIPVAPAQRFEAAPSTTANTAHPMPSLERPSSQPIQRPEMHSSSHTPAQEQQRMETIDQTVGHEPEQHVEHSAWHSIVVDKRGHEVAGAIEYGEGFKRERQQEAIQDRMAAGSVAAGAGSATAMGPSGYQQQDHSYQYESALPSGLTTPGLPQGQPSHIDPQHQLPSESKKQAASNMASPWFWIMLFLIIAAFFTAALV